MDRDHHESMPNSPPATSCARAWSCRETELTFVAPVPGKSQASTHLGKAQNLLDSMAPGFAHGNEQFCTTSVNSPLGSIPAWCVGVRSNSARRAKNGFVMSSIVGQIDRRDLFLAQFTDHFVPDDKSGYP